MFILRGIIAFFSNLLEVRWEGIIEGDFCVFSAQGQEDVRLKIDDVLLLSTEDRYYFATEEGTEYRRLKYGSQYTELLTIQGHNRILFLQGEFVNILSLVDILLKYHRIEEEEEELLLNLRAGCSGIGGGLEN
jgi:hypothetical protein